MREKKGFPIILTLFAIITANGLLKLYDTKTGTFEKPALAIVYGITLSAFLFFIVNFFIRRNKNKEQ